MFDENKIKELQNKSHVRGKLNKQFYSAQQEQLQKKRRQMKYILDQQVQQKRRQKQKQRHQQQRKLQQQEERIKAYYAQMEQRQKKPQNNNSSGYAQNQSIGSQPGKNIQAVKNNGSGMYDSRAVVHQNSNIYGYYSKQNVNQVIHRSKSRTQYEYDSGDIPVMPVMQSPQKQKQRNNQSLQSGNSSQHNNMEKQPKLPHRSSAGNIPLLALTLQQQKRQKKKSKRNPTKRDQKQKQKQKPKQKQRKPTFADQQYVHGNSRQQTQLKQVFGDLNQELQEQNKQLKKQLKKRQQAISLLMGAVRSNAKLDKFRVQAERILHGQISVDTKPLPTSQVQSRARKNSNKEGYQASVAEQQKKQSMLPKLKLHHQSIMHDYMFGSARRAHLLKAKTFK